MKILIKDDADELELTDEVLDNDNFVDVVIRHNELEGTKESTNFSVMTVPLNELSAVVAAFQSKRLLNRQRDIDLAPASGEVSENI